MKKLRTVPQVFDALDGIDNIARITEANAKQPYSWLGKDQFPANTYVALTRALNRRGFVAPATLWAMKGVKRAA